MTKKRNVLIYNGVRFLPLSCTFIYRQLQGISQQFVPYSICAIPENQDRFGIRNLFIWKRSFFEKALNSILFRTGFNLTFISKKEIKVIRELISSHEIDLIHAHFGVNAVKLFEIAKEMNVPMITTLHGIDITEYARNRRYLKKLQELTNYSKVICVSEGIRTHAISLGISPHNLIVHYIGIPLDKFPFVHRESIKKKASKGERITFLQVSRLSEKKGIEVTLNVFAKFIQKHDNSSLLIAGDGPLKKQLISLSGKLGLQNKVQFIGSVNSTEVFNLFSKSDVFLHHSITSRNGDKEGLPTVIAEAMATGMPVVSTYHSGIPELIEDQLDGFLVHEKDQKAYLSKLTSLLKKDYSELPMQAHKKVNSIFNVKKQNKKLVNIYQSFLR